MKEGQYRVAHEVNVAKGASSRPVLARTHVNAKGPFRNGTSASELSFSHVLHRFHRICPWISSLPPALPALVPALCDSTNSSMAWNLSASSENRHGFVPFRALSSLIVSWLRLSHFDSFPPTPRCCGRPALRGSDWSPTSQCSPNKHGHRNVHCQPSA